MAASRGEGEGKDPHGEEVFLKHVIAMLLHVIVTKMAPWRAA